MSSQVQVIYENCWTSIQDQARQGVITPDYIESILKEMHLFKDVVLALKLHVIKASPKSDMAVVWVDIWDSQSSSLAKNIINCCFNVG